MDFETNLKKLDHAVRKARLIHKIEINNRLAKNASQSERSKLGLETLAYKQQLELLDSANPKSH